MFFWKWNRFCIVYGRQYMWGHMGDFPCKWVLLLPVFHFTLVMTWLQPETEKYALDQNVFFPIQYSSAYIYVLNCSPMVWCMFVLLQQLECKIPKQKSVTYTAHPGNEGQLMQLPKPTQDLSSWLTQCRFLEKPVELFFLLNLFFSNSYVHIFMPIYNWWK